MSPLRRRMIEDMTVRKFVENTQKDYIRHVKDLTAFLGRSPATPSWRFRRRSSQWRLVSQARIT
jgi:hypothetical protein